MFRRMMSALMLLGTGTVLAAPMPYTALESPVAMTVRATAVPFDASDPAARGTGRLRYVGGVRLTADHPAFGGLSALAVAPDGRALAISDQGHVLAFSIVEAQGRPQAIRDAVMAPLRDTAGRAGTKLERDAESLSVDWQRGLAEVALERSNMIYAYRADPEGVGGFSWTASGAASPSAMRLWPLNGGAEAMTRLVDGRLLLLSEEAPAGEGLAGAVYGPRAADEGGLRDDKPLLFSYVPPAGFKPTSAATLSDGRVLVLNRQFSLMAGVAAALVLIDPAELKAGATLRGHEIARLRPPQTVDNMEGLAVVEQDGRRWLWLLSDDNFLSFQRTLLLKFELLPE